MSEVTVERRVFGQTAEGETVSAFTLTNASGLSVDLMDYGASLIALRQPDARGEIDDIVLGFDSFDGYLGPHPFFGGTIGRFANRIREGRFRLDGRDYVLACNNGANHLHGGVRGFDRQMWSASESTHEGVATVRFRRLSPDGEEGYPGNLECEVAYSLTGANELRIDYVASTDRSTVLNLTHHSYFNLAGRRGSSILDHELMVKADAFLPVDQTQIPLGEHRSVEGTAFDFRQPRVLGAAVATSDPQLAAAHGVDHNFVLNEKDSEAADGPRFIARVRDPLSNRVMEMFTTEPGLQVYFGGFLDGSIVGKDGRSYARHDGLCLEAQGFPDAPNQAAFPSCRLDPGQTYRTTTIYKFSAVTASRD